MSKAQIGARTSDGVVVASDVVEAGSFAARWKGWMFRDSVGPDEGLLLPDCGAIHTCFMRIPIDVVFLDGGRRILEIRGNLLPWRVASSVGAVSVLELAAGRARKCNLCRGMVLTISGRPA